MCYDKSVTDYSYSCNASQTSIIDKDEDAASEGKADDVDMAVVTAAYFQDHAPHKIYTSDMTEDCIGMVIAILSIISA